MKYDKKKNLFYIFAGTVLEHLDGMLFALYVPLMAGYFFDASNFDTKWFLGFLSFSLYFVVRPLGAMLLGTLGDRYGRKIALLISIGGMSVATMGMGIAPSYSVAGLYATALFLLLRIIQGLSVGGEYSTAMTYVFETVPEKRQLFYGALLIATTHLGGTLASICAYTNPHKFQYVFVAAGIAGLLFLRARMMLTETYVPKEKFSLANYVEQGALFRYLNVFGTSACLIFIFYTTMVYFNKLIAQKFSIDMENIFFINLILHLVWVIGTPLVGFLGDYFSIPSVKIMRIGSLCTLFLGIPSLVVAYFSNHLVAFVAAQIITTISHLIFCTPTPKMICGFFATHTRNAHVSLSYSVGVSVTAALVPMINDFAYQHMNIYGTALLMGLFALLGMVSTVSPSQHSFWTCLKRSSE